MFQKKIKKYRHLLESYTFQKREIKQLTICSITAKLIIEAFKEVKNNSFSIKEQKRFKVLEEYRKELLKSNELICFDEIGNQRCLPVSSVVKKAASPLPWSKFFYAIAHKNKSKNILEIGTNLGVSGQYFVEAIKDDACSTFTSLEGIKRMCEYAKQQFSKISSHNNVNVIHGLYDNTLKQLITPTTPYDLIFIDGNHTYAATVKYFHLLKRSCAENAIIIVDDINWSVEMNIAWEEIKNDPLVHTSIDFFKLGILLFEKSGKQKQHHRLFLTF